MTARLYIGTSSWAERSLIDSGRFYPPGLKDTPQRLAHFARRFNLAEVDSTYYAFTSSRNAGRWAEATPQGFLFDVKLFALFTQHPTNLSSIPKSFHEALPPEKREKSRLYYKDVPQDVRDELWRIFLRTLSPLREAGKLGALLLDFPPWFVPSGANREYIGEARRHLEGERVVVEFRNPMWVADEAEAGNTFALLRELDLGFVCVDEPQGLKSSFPAVVAATSAVACIRFRGRNAELWEARGVSTLERLNWWYSDDELSQWLPRIEALSAQADELHITFNTKFEDQSVVNAGRLQRLLGIA